MSDLPVYVDHHATTPCDPRVVEAMLPWFTERFGNPASITHAHGRQASTAVEEARASIASFFGVRSNEVYFTAGATESNNIALTLARGRGRHLVTTAIEHKSILAPAARLEREGVEVTRLAPDREGFVSAARLREALRPDTSLVSIGWANSEIGTIQRMAELAAVCEEAGVPLHSDATQAAGRIPVPLDEIPVALLSISAHKFYGPKGIGGLVVRRGTKVESPLLGGGQEKGMRAGTVNVPGVIGMSAALELRSAEMAAEAARLTAMRNRLWDGLVAGITGASVHGPRELRLPGNLSVSFERVEAEALIMAMRHFSLSSGSACSSGDREPSHVLMAIGVSEREAMGAIRIGLGASNTSQQAELLLSDLIASVARLREIAV